MNPRTRPSSGDDPQRGFALLVLLGVVGFGSVGILLAVQSFLPPLADVPVRAERNLETVDRAARFAFRTGGAFPANLTALIAATHLDGNGDWRIDPWASPTDLDYRRVTAGANVRSRGRDKRLGTADDVAAVVLAEDLVRVRQRARLRLIRAVLSRSQYCSTPSMTPADHDAMRAAMRDQATSRRAWLTADAPTRVSLQATLTASAATIAALRSTHACPPIPNRVVGAGGLMGQLGMPDSRGVDGIGRRLLRDVTIGVVAAGFDRTGGTDDDM